MEDLKVHHVGLITGGVLLIGTFLYLRSHKAVKGTGALNGQPTGYGNEMTLTPSRYSPTSFQGAENLNAFYEDDYTIPVTWSFGENGGNGMDVNAGWTAYSDAYSARMSNNWLQSEAQGAHLP